MLKRRAFTLVELMVVVAIIVLLVSLLIPAVSHARAMAITAQCSSRLTTIGIAFSSYAANNAGILPATPPWTHPDWNVNDYRNLLLLSWPDSLYIDGNLGTGTGNKHGRMNNNASWHYPLCWEKLFQCPAHEARFQYGSDHPTARGYGMAWMATPKGERPEPVRVDHLNPAHIMVTEGGLMMGIQGAYPQPAGHPSYGQYGMFQRHLKNRLPAANFLMADGHVELSEEYGRYASGWAYGGTPSAAQMTAPRNIWFHP